jgi:pyruvate dehydrogenase E1 component beta subunit
MTFNFALQSIDHIINSAAKTCYMSAGRISVPIVFRGPNGFALGVGAQHTQNFASWFAHCPGLKVIAPYSSEDAKGLLKSAIRDPDPVIFLEHEILYDTVFEMSHEALSSEFLLPIGKAKIEREGNGVTLVSYARGVEFCLDAAQDLASQHGIEATVINLRTLRPLDMPCIVESLAKTGHIVLVEEDWPFCGISSEISARICENPDTFKLLKSPVARVSCADLPTPYVKTLETLTIPTRKDICNVVLKSVKFSK